jgi:heme exporter protein C
MRTANRLVPVFLLLAAVMLVRAPYLIADAPAMVDDNGAPLGIIFKIFFYHVPLAAAELVVVFGLITLVTGPLWARKAWGVWWQWEARLTITLIMWMIFVAYLLLRRFGGPGADVLAAAVGLFGAVLVPFVYWSVNVWRTLHPPTTVAFSLPPPLMYPFLWCLAAFLIFNAALLIVRVRLEQARAALEDAYLALED